MPGAWTTAPIRATLARMCSPEARTALVKSLALEAGFSRVGIAPVGPLAAGPRFVEWLRRGYQGEMDYMEREPERRADPRGARGWARSAIALALDYHTDHPLSVDVPDDRDRGWISRYAWGRDYHYVALKRLRALESTLNAHAETRGRHHWYVDTGPLLEKPLAALAGLGWQGKNTLLIHPKAGSWFFLAFLLSDLELVPDAPMPDLCGTCTRCLDACPTAAFPEPGVLDARRCISYLTIEQEGDIPAEHRGGVGRHVFGCDICQDVCPWNRKAPTVDEPDFEPRPGMFHPRLDALLALDEEGFRDAFTRSPVKRRKAAGLRMSVASAMRRSEHG
ncbi:MAG: epoxyqueuosine reductase [Myxococcales bacterium]